MAVVPEGGASLEASFAQVEPFLSWKRCHSMELFDVTYRFAERESFCSWSYEVDLRQSPFVCADLLLLSSPIFATWPHALRLKKDKKSRASCEPIVFSERPIHCTEFLVHGISGVLPPGCVTFVHVRVCRFSRPFSTLTCSTRTHLPRYKRSSRVSRRESRANNFPPHAKASTRSRPHVCKSTWAEDEIFNFCFSSAVSALTLRSLDPSVL